MNALDGAGGGYLRRLAAIAAAAGTTLVVASGALAAQAAAATIAANQACYVNINPSQGAPMTIIGSAFTPGDAVDISGGTVFATGTVSANGTFAIITPAPILKTVDPASKSTLLTVTDETTPGVTATVTVKSANFAVLPKPLSVRNVHKDKVTYSFSGFRPGKHIYGYWLRKKVVGKTKFGKAKGACGVLRQKALLYPGGHPTATKYTVVFEQTSRYSKRATPRFSGVLSIDTL
jgi:hypothetical protein